MVGALDVDGLSLCFVGCALVDHREPRVNRGAMPREDLAVDGGGKHHIGALANPLKRRLEGFRRGAEAFASDDDKTSARREACEGGQDMSAGCLREPALDMVRCGEGRVHCDDRRRDRPIQPVVDRGGIVIRQDSLRKQLPQQGAARVGKLVQRKPCPCDPCEHRQHTGASGWLEHQIFGSKPRRLGHDGRKGQRGRELLQTHAVLRTPRVRRGQLGEALDHGEKGLRRACLALHQRSVAREHQDLSHLGSLIGVFPHPGTAGVAGAEGIFHCGAENGGVDGAARLEQRDKGSCSLHQVLGEARGLAQGRGFGLGGKLDGMGVSVHRQSPGLRVGPEPRAHSLTREGSPLPPCLSLFHGSADLRPAAETYPQKLGMGLWTLSRKSLSA